MTDYQLFSYKMTQEELDIWNAFAGEIAEKCQAVDLPQVTPEAITKRLVVKKPCEVSRGYCKEEGYFEVFDGDRGHVYSKIKTHSKEKAMKLLFSEIAHDISYDYVFANRAALDAKHQPEWRFYSVWDGVKGGRSLRHLEENVTWKYDAEYDYRKVWFEMTLAFCKKVLSADNAWTV